MNSSYGSFDFTGGWQDDSAGRPVAGYHSALPYLQNAQQAPAATHEDDETTTADPYWKPSGFYAPGYYDGTFPCENPLSTSCPNTNTLGFDWDDGSGFANVSDFEVPPSSFSESDLDYFPMFNYSESPAQSLPIMPTYNPFMVKPEAFTPAIIQTPTFAEEPLNATALSTNPPNLFHCTLHPPTSPPLNDCRPGDPLLPRSRLPRFDTDLYTPTFVRGAGPTRSGWCGYCATWHTLKDSAYWYHMHFAHGISCATGARLPDPLSFRNTVGAARGVGDWEALCGGCGRWVLVVEGEKGRTAWFRHAYKCLLKGAPGPGGLGRQRSRGGRPKSRSPRKVVVRPAL